MSTTVASSAQGAIQTHHASGDRLFASPHVELLQDGSSAIDRFLAFARELLHVHAVAHLQLGLGHEQRGVDPVPDALEVLDPCDAVGVLGILDRPQ